MIEYPLTPDELKEIENPNFKLWYDSQVWQGQISPTARERWREFPLEAKIAIYRLASKLADYASAALDD